MTEFSYPFASGSGATVTETDWSRLLRDYASQGVIGDPGGAPLQVYADSSGRQVFVRAGQANVRGHHYVNDATKTLAIAANASGSSRTDLIVLRLDPSADTVTAIALTGGTGFAQTDTGTYDLPLASVVVANGAVTLAAGTVTDTRRFSGLDLVPCRAVADVTSPRLGQLAFESSTGLLKLWNGSVWRVVQLDSDTGWLPLSLDNLWTNYGAGYAPAQYRRIGGVVHVEGLVKADPVSSSPGDVGVLPVGFRPAATVMFATYGADLSVGRVFRLDVQTNGQIIVPANDAKLNLYLSIACSFPADV